MIRTRRLFCLTLLLLSLAVTCEAASRPGRSLPEGRMDVVYSMEVETPHIKWADQLRAGPIRAWLMPSVVGGRDLVELAQRLALEYDTLTVDTAGANAWGFGDFYGKRGHGSFDLEYRYLTEDLTGDTRYEVLVIPGTHPWNAFPQEAREALLQRVRDGAGLVLIAPSCDPENLLGLDDISPLVPLAFVPADTRAEDTGYRWGDPWQVSKGHYITRNVPLEVLPLGEMGRRSYRSAGDLLVESGGDPLIAVRSYGAGRVVAFGYENLGFSPRVRNPWAVDKSYPYWEYYYSLLSRAIVWAAGREPDLEIARLSPPAKEGPNVVKVARAGGEQAAAVELVLRDERYQERLRETREVRVGANGGEAVFSLPAALNGGLHFADVIVRGEAGVLDWGTVTFEAPRAISIAQLQAAREVVEVGERVAGTVRLRSDGERKATVRLAFEDNYGRVLAQEEHRVSVDGEAALAFDLSTAHCLTRRGVVVCRVSDGDLILDQKQAALFVRIPQIWDDYEIIMDRFLPEPAPGRWPAIAERLNEMNVSVMGAISPAMSEHMNFKIQANVVAYNFHPRDFGGPFWRNQRAYSETGDKQYLIREPCYTDPVARDRFRESLRTRVAEFVRFSPISYYAYEEPSLTYFTRALDVCWSPTCLAGFRQWLRQTYGTLEALNQEWNASYVSWDNVLPLTAEEAQAAGNYPPWADFRTWMEVMYADVYREGRDIIRSYDPHATICLSGNQRGTPFNGYDYSRINRYVDQMQQYTGENLEDFNRSLYPHVLPTGCTGYGVSDPALSLQLWGRLLNGDTAGCVIFWEISCLDPDLTFSQSGADLARHFGELRGDGIARLLSTAERDNCGIAIYYSYPSLHGTWITDGESRNSRGRSRAARMFDLDRVLWTELLEGLGYQYDFVSYQDIGADKLRERGYRLLIMPETVAVSEAEAAAIEEFVRSGGVVIADIWPAVMDEHCRWREAGRLDRLFGISQKSVAPADFLAADARERVNLAGADRGWCEGHPQVARNRHGEGTAFYLGQSLGSVLLEEQRERVADYLDVAAKLLGAAGVAPPVSVVNERGEPATTCEVASYHADGVDYLGVVRYQSPAEGAEEVGGGVPDLAEARGLGPEKRLRITFPSAGHVYDVRARQYLGYVDQVGAALDRGDAKIYARLPYLVDGIEVEAPASASPGEAVRYEVRVAAPGESKLGTHVAIVRVYSPDGQECRPYQGRLTLKHGVGSGTIPLAVSDAAGVWKIVARDVATGVEGAAAFTVS